MSARPIPAPSPSPVRIPGATESQYLAINQELHARIAELNDELQRERRARAEQLQEKARVAERLRRLLDGLPAGVVVLDGRGRVAECNPAAVDLLGEPLCGMPWREVIARCVEAEAGGDDVVLRDGRRLALSTCPLGDEPGQILLLNEVTDRRLLEERLGHHRRLADMGRMAASLAHQVRTPLSSALLYAGHLQNPRLPEEKRDRFAERLLQSLRGMERLVNDMVTFSRSGLQGMESLAPAALLQEVLEGAADELESAGARVERVDETGGARIRGNRTLLHTALRNLVTNALQVVPEGARLLLVGRPGPGGTVELEVRDNGPGIPDDQRERVFEPFVSGRSGGTGLGLAVVRAVARAHQGEVWAEPAPAGGTRMVLRLPRTERDNDEEQA
ncbi:MAG TPA: ATP-binding protein [Gammaproteobacteria bacterium]|nr:ATP-binding protein [Gammaproteobacteria bacterium]